MLNGFFQPFCLLKKTIAKKIEPYTFWLKEDSKQYIMELLYKDGFGR
jgi:hypothetical protein